MEATEVIECLMKREIPGWRITSFSYEAEAEGYKRKRMPAHLNIYLQAEIE